MIIEKIYLENYRNHANMEIYPSSGVNLIVGNNGVGKTNILEAVYYGAYIKSHRTSNDRDLIAWSSNLARIAITFNHQDRQQLLELSLMDNGKRQIKKNGVKLNSPKDAIGVLRCVLFCPEELAIVKEGPSARRAFLDRAICPMRSGYMENIRRYSRIVTHKNIMLKSQNVNDALIYAYNFELARLCEKITQMRESFVGKLDSKASKLHFEMTSGKEQLSLVYNPFWNGEKSAEQMINSALGQELRLKSSVAGCHRDDVMVLINKKDIRKFGSQGQQRSAVLSVKMALALVMNDDMGCMPCLLMDDYMSELDKKRQDFLLNSNLSCQIIITCADLDKKINGKKILIE